jgi:ABC-2 type transport system ATP-binding protein
VSVANVDLKKSPVVYRKQVSYAEAEPQFPPTLTGTELIQFFGQTRNADQARLEALIDHFQVGNFLNQAVGGYSSGMIKKLSILLAFIGSPKLILLDEPLITLDVNFIPLLLSVIKKKQDEGISFLITSHQAFEDNKFAFNGKLVVRDHCANLELK